MIAKSKNRLSPTIAVMACLLFGVLLVSMSTVVYGSGQQDGPVPAHVGAAGANADGEPRNPDEVRGEVGEDGEIWIDVKHKVQGRQGDGPNMTDLHVKIVFPKNAKIADIDTANSPFEDHEPMEDPDGDGDTDDADDPSETGSADVGDGQDLVEFDDTITIKLKLVDEDGEPLDEDQSVTFEVWWTRNDEVVANTNTDRVGETAGTEMVSIVPNYNPSAAQVSVSGSFGTETCNDIALGETYGYVFQDGDFVLTPDTEARFAITVDTEVRAFDENGLDVTGTDDFTASDLRIDDAGNFVFRVSRDQEAETHIAIVIRKLEVDLPGLQAGDVVSGTVSGAAVSGIYADDIYELVKVVD